MEPSWAKKYRLTPRGPTRPGPGEGVGGGVNHSPKGKKGVGRGSSLNHSRPEGLVGFHTACSAERVDLVAFLVAYFCLRNLALTSAHRSLFTAQGSTETETNRSSFSRCFGRAAKQSARCGIGYSPNGSPPESFRQRSRMEHARQHFSRPRGQPSCRGA